MKFKLALLLLLLSASLSSQVILPTPPLAARVEWSRNPATDQIIDYAVTHFNGKFNTTYTVTDILCAELTQNNPCGLAITIPDMSIQTVTVVARNKLGISKGTSITFDYKSIVSNLPSKATGIKIIKL